MFTFICIETGLVSYVGKGHSGRAWDEKTKRSASWHEKVNSLKSGYKVVLAYEDLIEDESILLEQREIEKMAVAQLKVDRW